MTPASSPTKQAAPDDPEAVHKRVLRERVDGLRRDVGRLYRWVLALVGSNLSLVFTVLVEMLYFS